MTDAQILADALLPPGSAMLGEFYAYTAGNASPTVWTPSVGAASNAPAIVSLSSVPVWNFRGSVEPWGDSITLGRAVGGVGDGLDGWRRSVQMQLSAAGRPVAFVGFQTAYKNQTDYNFNHSATGGESLNTRLATLASDLLVSGDTTCATILAYGINDLVTLLRTSAQLTADITTACGLINTARPGRPIVLVNIMDVATGAATAPAHTEINAFIPGQAARVATLRGLGYNVVSADVSTCVTNPNDAAQLFDGTHPSVTVYNAMAVVIGNALQTVM